MGTYTQASGWTWQRGSRRRGATAIGLALIALVGCGGDDPAAAPPTGAAVDTAAPTSPAVTDPPVTSPTSTAAESTTTTAVAAPAPLEFTDRVGYVGRLNRTVFELSLKSAEVRVDDAGRWSLAVDMLATNFSRGDQTLDPPTPRLLLADGTTVDARIDLVVVPGGGTSKVELTVASIEVGLDLSTVAIVFGNNASNQTILPFDESIEVTTFVPITGVGAGTTAAGGSGTVVTITDGVVWADYSDGAKDDYSLELAVDLAYRHPTDEAGAYEDATFILTAPDGISSSWEAGYLYPTNDVTVVASGQTAHLDLRFAVSGPVSGEYRLEVKSRRVRVYKDPGAVDPVLVFVVP